MVKIIGSGIKFSTDKNGNEVAKFQGGITVYDAHYKNSCHFNNYLFVANGDMVGRIKALKLEKGCNVTVTAQESFELSICEPYEGADKTNADYGRSRSANGVVHYIQSIDLIRFDAAGATQSEQREPEKAAEKRENPLLMAMSKAKVEKENCSTLDLSKVDIFQFKMSEGRK